MSSGAKDSILDKDLYALIGVPQDASVKDIRTAYRKRALECHPDKNPDDPNAAATFLELGKALAVLLDTPAREAYDKLVNARTAAAQRHRVLDSRRKRLKEDLEERERLAQSTTSASSHLSASHRKFQEEVERLRKMSWRQVEEEVNLVKEMMRERKTEAVRPPPRLRVRWTSPAGQTPRQLTDIFSKYGAVEAVAMSANKSSAVVEFCSASAAVNALKLESGTVDCPLTVSWVGEPPATTPASTPARTPPPPPKNSETNDEDFEQAVLRRMREAQAQKSTAQDQASDSGSTVRGPS